jgi:opacity protein-like surface antigen
MRNYLLAAAAAIAVASPAAARDGAPYVGIEGGLIFDGKFKGDVDYVGNDGDIDFAGSYDNAVQIDMNTALDADIIAGYDFGMFRLEGELGYKRLKSDDIRYDDGFVSQLADDLLIDPEDLATAFDVSDSGRGRVISGMVNGLVDFGNESGVSFYGGAGFGRAGVKFEGVKDSTWAWQLIAGLRAAVTPNVDLGLKYRYFRTGRLHFTESYEDPASPAFFDVDQSGHLRTHSILASLIYNFAAPMAPPPPPPPPPPAPEPAPATQTCYDGSVILATDTCPVPPPPPPPPPVPERG